MPATQAPALAREGTSLQDKYSTTQGWVYLTGAQALVRLPLQQRLRDQAQGLNTGGYISGYRGSPLGRYDMELWVAEPQLKAQRVVFRAGLNEDLAATAIWGAQYVGSFPGAQVDGVFGIWYGKGPGVDRSGDALRHANLAGTSPLGGVLALAGDDHGAKSSTIANFSDQIFMAVGMPLLYPSNTQELLDLGLHGIAMSRFSGCWVGMKVVTDVVEGGGSVYVAPDHPKITLPEPPTQAAGPFGPGYHIRRFDMPLAQEDRLYHHKHQAVLAYARANELNRITLSPPGARIGVVAAGKAWQDLRQAMGNLGLTEARAAELGLRLLKISMVWPLDPAIVQSFAQGLETILVVEEKRPLLEEQIRSALYGGASSPHIIGKHGQGGVFDPACGPRVFPNAAELSPPLVAAVLAELLGLSPHACTWANGSQAQAPSPKATLPPAPTRLPGFCSGCPHNRSTKVIEGSRALAGIGCHTMAMLVNPQQTTTVSHMGAEGVMWLGQQPFTSERHVFANIGDGTLAHSGFLALRQAVAAGVPITYKILYNGFVSMTGGQPVETGQTPAQILHGLHAEGVEKMAVVTDDPSRYEGVALPTGTPVHPRSALDAVQREFRDHPGVSVILYDQACATERRRLRKRGKWADPPQRSFINAAVCEGCGDCGAASNCMSIEPLETEFGRKRRINQGSCNKDFSCVEGFCPSFVTVHGGTLRKAPAAAATSQWTEPLTEQEVPALDGSFSVLIGGIGGTGVVTIGQTLAMAAHLQGLFSSNLDITGLSQKYGAVTSHVRIASQASGLNATRIAAAEADTLIGCDLIVAAGDEAISKLRPGRSQGVVCTDLIPTSEFARNPDWQVDAPGLVLRLQALLGDQLLALDGQRLATSLLGDAISANMFMLGAAWQRGQIPLQRAAIERAIELNGVAVALNQQAFVWGRRAAQNLAEVERLAGLRGEQPAEPTPGRLRSLNEIIEHRSAHMLAHTGPALVERYVGLVRQVQVAEKAAGLGESLSRAVAQGYAKLLAVKDEWEVARLYAHPDFRADVARQFEGGYTLRFHVGAWPFARTKGPSHQAGKTELGPWLMTAFRWMSRLRHLRGSWLDPFRHSAERQLERELVAQYEQDMAQLVAGLNERNHGTAVKLASLPEKVRGYGHVKAAHAEAMRNERATLLSQLTV